MKTKLLISALIIGTALVATAAKDPVLMKINGKDIKLSEFQYLYHKNNEQQVEKESLEKYLDRFINFKLKVADAEAAKIDTLDSFENELNGYREDLVRPFLEDTTIKAKLVKEQYERMKVNVNIDHLMLPLGKDFADNKVQLALADSLRACLKAGENWDSIVMKYSIDPSRTRNGGHYGYITAGTFPYSFEYAAFNTPVGEISQPIRTDFGLHVIRVNDVRPDEGTVRARHILRLFPRNHKGADFDKAEIKAKIDSIYQLIKDGGNFEELAKQFSEDPGSAKRGGDLGYFGRGRMVPEFENAAFSLANGEVSEPFETSYGYHIVQKVDQKSVMPFEEAKANIEKRISMDERAHMPKDAIIEKAKKQYNFAVNKNLDKYIADEIASNGGYDSALVAKLRQSNFTALTYANESTPVSVVAKKLNPKSVLNNDAAKGYFMSLIDGVANEQVMHYYTDNLINDNVDYRNLINEYRDGMLLFEISNRKVWEGASKDTTGLNNFFEANKVKYAWGNDPHFKGIILSAKSDSIMDAVKADIETFGRTDSLTTLLHKKYTNNIKMERMVVAKGENKAADYLFFNGPAITSGAYTKVMVLEGGLIYAPETLNDVKGQVTNDYQEVLEKKWMDELKAKYPVTVYKKVLKQIK